MAHRLALASEKVTADVIEANEFPELSRRYGVRAVPTTVISLPGEAEPRIVIGSMAEGRFVNELTPKADEATE